MRLTSPETNRAVVPRRCEQCDCLHRLRIRAPTGWLVTHVWTCRSCGAPNTIASRWQYLVAICDRPSARASSRRRASSEASRTTH